MSKKAYLLPLGFIGASVLTIKLLKIIKYNLETKSTYKTVNEALKIIMEEKLMLEKDNLESLLGETKLTKAQLNKAHKSYREILWAIVDVKNIFKKHYKDNLRVSSRYEDEFLAYTGYHLRFYSTVLEKIRTKHNIQVTDFEKNELVKALLELKLLNGDVEIE